MKKKGVSVFPVEKIHQLLSKVMYTHPYTCNAQRCVGRDGGYFVSSSKYFFYIFF